MKKRVGCRSNDEPDWDVAELQKIIDFLTEALWQIISEAKTNNGLTVLDCSDIARKALAKINTM